MNRIIVLLTVFFTVILLTSCAAGRYPYPTSKLSEESWVHQIDTDSSKWAVKADQWFLSGDQNDSGSYKEGMSNTTVRVTNFHNIKISGDFQVRLVGSDHNNSVYIEGPNDAVRAISVTVSDDALCLQQMDHAPANMGRVIVNIRVRDLRVLEHHGRGSVEGVRLFTNDLNIQAYDGGSIFLAGHINVKCIVSRGSGSVNVFTIHADNTEIESLGSGDVNVEAKRQVVLKSIKHHGVGDINIIGAASNGLIVDADGKGKIGIKGCVNVKDIRASGETCVFISTSESNAPCIYVYDDARVGINGAAGTLYGYTTRTSRLMARNLVATDAYVEAFGESHMNVRATRKIFATVHDYATIYFFGNPAILTKFEKNYGTVIVMSSGSVTALSGCYPGTCEEAPKIRHRDYKDELGSMR